MRYFSQSGRTMLETMMVMGIIGILSITGIYMYKNAMNGVRADAIIKDVLLRASQVKGNADLNRSGIGKRVYTPEYKKTKGSEAHKKTTKGRYGYSYQEVYHGYIARSCVNDEGIKKEYVVIRTGSTQVTKAVCDSLKSKLSTYKNANNKARIACMSDNTLSLAVGCRTTDIPCTPIIECPDKTNLDFLIYYTK